MVTREEVVWAYRFILGREPESEAAIEWHLDLPDLATLRRAFLQSQEFAGISRVELVTHPVHGLWVAAPVLASKYLMWIDLSDRYVSAGCLFDDYEREGTRFVRSVLRPGDVAVDAGANIGWYTLIAADIVGEGGQVHAFEPRTEIANYLEKTVGANHLAERVSIYRCGLSDTSKEGMLGWRPSFFNSGSAALVDDVGDLGMVYQAISLRRLDELGLSRLDFLKADVEGAEMRLFSGARATIERCRPVILSEMSPPMLERVSGVSAKAFFDFFAELGYRCFIVEREHYGEEVRAFPNDWPVPLINIALLPDNRTMEQPRRNETPEPAMPGRREVVSVGGKAGEWSKSIRAALQKTRARLSPGAASRAHQRD